MNPLADCLAALSVIATGSSCMSVDQLGSVAIDVYLVGRLDQGCDERLALVELYDGFLALKLNGQKAAILELLLKERLEAVFHHGTSPDPSSG